MYEQHSRQIGETIPTGSLRLDIALGIGGVPRGRFIEICGPVSCGKTTLCQHIISEAQELGYLCAFVDADHALDPQYAERCGVNLDRLYVSEPAHAEQALEITETLANSGVVAVVVVDSVTTLVPRDELKETLGEISESSSDNILSQTLRRLSNIIQSSNTAIIFTNQVGRRGSAVYHKLATNPARLALKLHTSLRLDLSVLKPIRNKDQVLGNRVQIKVVKNNLAPCFRAIELDMMYNHGINKAGEIFDLGTDLTIINKQGSMYYFRGLRLGTRRREAIHFLEQDIPVSKQIEQIIRQKLLHPDQMLASQNPKVAKGNGIKT